MRQLDTSLLQAKKEKTPTEFAHHLLEKGPLFFWEKGPFWVVTDFKLGEEVLRSPKYSADRSSFFISRMPNLDLRLIKDFFAVVMKMMVMSDGKEHTARRKLTNMGLTDELLDYYRPKIQETVNALIEDCARDATFDFVTQIAEKLPSMILADLFEIPESNRPNFLKWSNNMTQFFGGASAYQNADGIEVNESASNIRNFFQALVKKRKVTPGTDFLSIMLENQQEFGLTDEEIISQAIMMLVAGQVTTTDQLGSNFFTLLTTPGVQDTLRTQPELIPTAIEEFNRLDPAVTFVFRVVKEETLLGTQVLKAGDVVFVSTHAVNRNASVFPHPNACQLDRKYNPHFAFGHGLHFCLGAKLARTQMQILFSTLLNRFPNMQLKAPAVRKHYSLAFSGFESLPVGIRPGSFLPGRLQTEQRIGSSG